MRQEVKDVSQLLLIMISSIAVLCVGWFNSPMYKNMYRQQRNEALFYLQSSYYLPDDYYFKDRQAIIDKYGFTEEEIKPQVMR